MTLPWTSAAAYAAIWMIFWIVRPARDVIVVQARALPGALRRDVWLGLGCGLGLVIINVVILLLPGQAVVNRSWSFVPVGVVAAVVWTAVVSTTEEMMVRGLLLTRLRQVTGDPAGVVLTAAVFAGMHVGRADFSVSSVAQHFVDGLLLGWLVLVTGSIWTSVGVHWGKNLGVAVAFGGSHRFVAPAFTSVASGGPPAWFGDAVTYALFIPLAIVAVRYGLRRDTPGPCALRRSTAASGSGE